MNEAGLLAISRILSLTTAVLDIAAELQKLQTVLAAAHAEGREFTMDDLARLDADLAAAKAAAR